MHLVLENDRNQSRYLGRDERARPTIASAQWNDDVHHVLHVLLTGRARRLLRRLRRRAHRTAGPRPGRRVRLPGAGLGVPGGEPRGEPSAQLPPQAFVDFLQTHDQVGNRAFGERLDALADPALMPAALAGLLLAPAVPMLFMGEEWGASTPFLFFCDFGPELAAAVSKGRREEFSRFDAFRDPRARERIPDPNEIRTFEASRLDWAERERTPHREREDLVRRLLAIRGDHLVSRFAGMRHGGEFVCEGEWLTVRWTLGDGSRLCHQISFTRGDAPVGGLRGTASGAGAQRPLPGLCLFEHAVRTDPQGGLVATPGAIRVTLEDGDE